jgi:NodT family efflux transporter outer membrane factor (OMF) lipoprotein
MKYITLMILPLFLVSCVVGPDYVKPTAEVPAKYKEFLPPSDKGVWRVAEPSDNVNRGEWWLVFHDEKLNDLENRLNANNQSIIQAAANYRQAVALINEARAAFFPTVTGDAFVTRTNPGAGNGASAGTGGSAGSSGTTSATLFNNHSLLVDASWIPDLWGSVHRTVEANIAGAQSSAALLALTRLTNQSLLAQSYFQLAAFDLQQKILDDIVVKNQKIVDVNQYQYDSGVAGRAAVVAAQSALQAAQATAVNNHIGRAQTEHAIAILIGVPPSDLSLSPNTLPAKPPVVPVDLPSTLLERRPDVAQAERLMAQANANIGVAISAYFPALNLTAIAGFVGAGLGNWIAFPLYSTLFPELTDTIFDGGLRDATLAANRATYDSNVANYRQVLLAAFQNVEDNLVAQKTLAEQAKLLDDAWKSANHSLDIVINEYQSGTVDYINIANAQITALTAEQSLVTVQGLQMTSTVNLITALGGGWDSNSINDLSLK